MEPPRDQSAYFCYFSSKDSGNAEQLKANELKRLTLYKLTAALIRAYANIAGELLEAGITSAKAEAIKADVVFYENLRNEIKLHSGDAIDLKQFEPAMRHLIDTYIRAEESEKISGFDDMSLVELIVERGEGAINSLPKGIRNRSKATAETIENNVRKLIIDESPINPKYYEKMSELLDALIRQRREESISYQKYLDEIIGLAKKVKNPNKGGKYPASINTSATRALFDNLGQDEALAVAVDNAVQESMQDDWRGNSIKVKKVKNAIKAVLHNDEIRTDRILELVKKQHDY